MSSQFDAGQEAKLAQDSPRCNLAYLHHIYHNPLLAAIEWTNALDLECSHFGAANSLV